MLKSKSFAGVLSSWREPKFFSSAVQRWTTDAVISQLRYRRGVLVEHLENIFEPQIEDTLMSYIQETELSEILMNERRFLMSCIQKLPETMERFRERIKRKEGSKEGSRLRQEVVMEPVVFVEEFLRSATDTPKTVATVELLREMCADYRNYSVDSLRSCGFFEMKRRRRERSLNLLNLFFVTLQSDLLFFQQPIWFALADLLTTYYLNLKLVAWDEGYQSPLHHELGFYKISKIRTQVPASDFTETSYFFLQQICFLPGLTMDVGHFSLVMKGGQVVPNVEVDARIVASCLPHVFSGFCKEFKNQTRKNVNQATTSIEPSFLNTG